MFVFPALICCPAIASSLDDFGANSFYKSILNFTTLSYPAIGHYQLFMNSDTASALSGNDSVPFTIVHNDGVDPQCINCTIQTSTIGATAVPTSISGTLQTSPPAATVTVMPQSSSSLSGGAIAGIVVGVFAALSIAGALVWFFYLHKRLRRGSKPRPVEEFFAVSQLGELDKNSQDLPDPSTLGIEQGRRG